MEKIKTEEDYVFACKKLEAMTDDVENNSIDEIEELTTKIVDYQNKHYKIEKPTIEKMNSVIAEYMGYRVFWKRYPKNHGIGAPEKEYKDCIAEKLKYHSSLDWLYPVWQRLANDLIDILLIHKIKDLFSQAAPISELHEAIYNAIVFLNQTK